MYPRIIPRHNVVTVPCASIISESEVSITILCLLCSPRYTAVWIKNCSKNTPITKVTTMKNTMVPCNPVIIWNWSIHCPSLSAVFNLLYSSTSQELFENHLCNQGIHYEKYQRFLLCKEAIMCNHQINAFHCQQRWMEHKGARTLVSPWRMHRTYCSMLKGISWAEAMLYSEKIKPVALAIIKLR